MSIRFRSILSLALVICITGSLPAQKPATDAAKDSDSKKTETESADEDQEEAKEKDPLAVPEDADADALLTFMREVKSKRKRTTKSYVATYKAVIAASEMLFDLDDKTDDQEMLAVREALMALNYVKNYDRSYGEKYDDLMDSLRNDDRPKFKKIATILDLSLKVRQISRNAPEKTTALINEYKDLVSETSMDRENVLHRNRNRARLGECQKPGLRSPVLSLLGRQDGRVGRRKPELPRRTDGRLSTTSATDGETDRNRMPDFNRRTARLGIVSWQSRAG